MLIHTESYLTCLIIYYNFRFLQFQKILQEEILALEFRRNDADGSGKISEKDFADLLIAYGGFLPKKRAKMLKRVKKTFDDENSLGIHLNDYLNFYQVNCQDMIPFMMFQIHA